MAGMVRVSGYSQTDMDNKYEEGYDDAISEMIVSGTSCASPAEGGTRTASYTVQTGYSGYAVCAVVPTNDNTDHGWIKQNGTQVCSTAAATRISVNSGDVLTASCAGGPRAAIACYIYVFLHK